ncbi:hypothetical protein ACFUOZ_11435 [Paenarthrobacter sp. NPDC057355]|uniref:hypothetical protein n=1 Tax=Paenarthrobacter sp. NPDC057355 TaxID=3346105 RepID=UPI00362D0133
MGLSDPPPAGSTANGDGAAVGLSSGTASPEGALDDGVALAPGAASVAGRI